MAETWFKVNKYAVTIEAVEVLSSTERFVVMPDLNWKKKHRREAKGTEYFPTFQEARNWLLDHFALNKTSAECNAAAYQKQWERAAALREAQR